MPQQRHLKGLKPTAGMRPATLLKVQEMAEVREKTPICLGIYGKTW